MKYVFYSVTIIATLWQWLCFRDDNFGMYLGSVMWSVAFIYGYDFWMAAIRHKSSPFYIEYYSQIKKDLITCVVVAFTLFFVVMAATAEYNSSNIDIAFTGIPFLALSAYDLFLIRKKQIAGIQFPKKVIFSLLGMVFTSYAFFAYILIQILGQKYSPMQSIWMQLTILFTSFYAFVATGQIKFFLEKERLEVSPVLLNLFKSIRPSIGILQNTEEMTLIFNQTVEDEKKKLKTKQDAAEKNS